MEGRCVMKQIKKTSLGLGWLIPSMVILANPIIAFYDILPDCIGYLLLCVALFRLSDLNTSIADAFKRFRTLIWISVGGYLMQYYIYEVLSKEPKLNPQEIPTMILLCSFMIAVPKLYFSLPAYRDLFCGFWELAERHGGRAVFHYGKRKNNLCERMRSASGLFVLLSTLFSILPELAVLTTFEYEMENLPFDWYQFVWLFRVSAAMVLTVCFVVWIVRFIRFALLFSHDADMMQSIKARYEQEILPQEDMLSVRRLRFGIVFLIIGAALTFNLCIEEEILLPGVLCAIFTCVGVLIFGEDLQKRRPFFFSCGVLTFLSLGELWLNRYYTQNYSYVESGWDPDAYTLFLGLRAIQVAEVFCAFALFWCLLNLLSDFVKARIFEHYDGEDTAEISARATERLHRSLERHITGSKILFFVSAFTLAFGAVFQLEYPWFWWVTIPTVAAATITFASLLYALLDRLAWQSNTSATHKDA